MPDVRQQAMYVDMLYWVEFDMHSAQADLKITHTFINMCQWTSTINYANLILLKWGF